MSDNFSTEKRGDIRKEVLSTGKHSLIYVAGQALSRAIGFFMIPVYTHFIAPADYGVMELIEIVMSIMTLTMSVGVSEGLSRFYYEEKTDQGKNRIVSTVILGLPFVGGGIVLLFLLLSIPIAEILLEGQYAFCLQVGMVTAWFTMLCDIGYSYLRMIYKAKTFVFVTTCQLIMALSLNIWFIVFCGYGILGVFYSTLISQSVVGLILSSTILHKTGYHISFSKFFDIVKFGLPLIPSRIGLMVGFMSNRFFLRWLSSPDPAYALFLIGLFSLGHKFGVVINRLVNSPFNSFWAPRRMELLLNGDTEAQRTVARICTYAVACLCCVALFISVGIESLIEIMADPKYKGAHIVVPFVSLSYVFLGLEMHFSAGILHQKKTKWISYITFLSVPIVLIWNYLFIPRFGLVGAATSNLAGGVVRVFLIYRISQRMYYIPFEIRRLILIFIVAFVLYGVAQAIYFYSPIVTLLTRLLFSSLFPVFLFPLRFYHDGEIEFVKSIISQSKSYFYMIIGRKSLS